MKKTSLLPKIVMYILTLFFIKNIHTSTKETIEYFLEQAGEELKASNEHRNNLIKKLIVLPTSSDQPVEEQIILRPKKASTITRNRYDQLKDSGDPYFTEMSPERVAAFKQALNKIPEDDFCSLELAAKNVAFKHKTYVNFLHQLTTPLRL